MEAFVEGNVAVVTGASSGIGKAACLTFASTYGMSVVMVDNDEAELNKAFEEVTAIAKYKDNILTIICDVSQLSQIESMRDSVMNKFKKVNVLFNNAGIMKPGLGVTAPNELWQKVIDVNFMGILHGTQAFFPIMKASGEMSCIINTGSKQGITCPPGNLAYNVSKAAVKAFTEGLEYECRQDDCNGNLSAFLLVPGWTNTGILRKSLRSNAEEAGKEFDVTSVFFHEGKPASGAWSAEQVVEFMMENIAKKVFYIICPDNDTDRITDNARMTWTMGDIVESRPPLSRWHPDYKEKFTAFLEDYKK